MSTLALDIERRRGAWLLAACVALSLTGCAGLRSANAPLETLVLADELLQHWGRDLSTPDRRVTTHMIHVSFAELADEEERRYFDGVPTNFNLGDDAVDRLREAGRRLLRESTDFQELLRVLR